MFLFTFQGLDPAGPLFYPRIGAAHVLSPTDASYVDVVHTEAPIGVAGNIGQADFYVNGGVYQPGCFFPGIWPEFNLEAVII